MWQPPTWPPTPSPPGRAAQQGRKRQSGRQLTGRQASCASGRLASLPSDTPTLERPEPPSNGKGTPSEYRFGKCRVQLRSRPSAVAGRGSLPLATWRGDHSEFSKRCPTILGARRILPSPPMPRPVSKTPEKSITTASSWMRLLVNCSRTIDADSRPLIDPDNQLIAAAMLLPSRSTLAIWRRARVFTIGQSALLHWPPKARLLVQRSDASIHRPIRLKDAQCS